MQWEDMAWIHVAKDRDMWWAFEDKIMKLRVL
jgi:hypothetical protein